MIDPYEVRQFYEQYIVQLSWQEQGLLELLQKEGTEAFKKIPSLTPLAELSFNFLWEDENTLYWVIDEPNSYPHAVRRYLPLPTQLQSSELSLYIQRKNWERSIARQLAGDVNLGEKFFEEPKATLETLGVTLPDHLEIRVIEESEDAIDVVIPLRFDPQTQPIEDLEQASGWQLSTSKLWVFHSFGANLNTMPCSTPQKHSSSLNTD